MNDTMLRHQAMARKQMPIATTINTILFKNILNHLPEHQREKIIYLYALHLVGRDIGSFTPRPCLSYVSSTLWPNLAQPNNCAMRVDTRASSTSWHDEHLCNASIGKNVPLGINLPGNSRRLNLPIRSNTKIKVHNQKPTKPLPV
jgi:hypothetical protein